MYLLSYHCFHCEFLAFVTKILPQNAPMNVAEIKHYYTES
jgi:hypothetical protein